jgi:hypothetical protein
MSEIQRRGLELLIPHLEKLGHSVSKYKKGTFDLSIDGSDAELKAKSKPFSKLDFISFTEKQYDAIKSKHFDTYILCNVAGESPEAYRISSQNLLSVTPNLVLSYEYPRSLIKNLVERVF